MYNLMVNGKQVSCETDKKLIDFLRDDLRLTSVKNGCGEGACGTCTVIVDGKATRACIPKMSKMENKSVVTTEGLSEKEKEVYGYAFAEAGAVQCGFCTPGMVMSAKALLDVSASPTAAEVKKALRGNICRCTGYVKIEKAVLLAAAIFRGEEDITGSSKQAKVGENFHRVDALDKTLGTGLYVDDLVFDGMVYGKGLRPKTPRERIISIDTSKALAHPDCVTVLTAKDIPGHKKTGHLAQDWDVMIGEGEITRYIGDAIALVASRNKETLDEILALIEVEAEALPVLGSPREAMADGAPKIHETGNVLSHEVLKRGDADEAMKKAAHIYTQTYYTPFTEHAFMEPECAVAMPENDGVLVYTSGQSVYDEQREIAAMLGISPDLVRCRSMLVGGGFGGKEDMSVQHHAALLAWYLKVPVKVKWSRQESVNFHPKRHAMEMKVTTACDKNGILLAFRAEVIADTGAYASLGGPVLQRACTHAAGPYNFQVIDIDGKAVYTNNPPAGAFRGFGVTQTVFASECNLNKLAEMVGISPWEIRYRNAILPGQVLPNGQIADSSTALKETLEAVKEIYENNPGAGIASCMKNAGLGVGIPDVGRCIVGVQEDGRVHIRTSAACIGQGLATVLMQIFCEVTGLNPELVIVDPPDSIHTPNSGTTTASRQTVFTGEACIRASKEFLEAMKEHTLDELKNKEFYGEFFPATDPMGSDKENPVSHVAYGYATQVAILGEDGRVEKIVAAHDVGRAINPILVEGQIEGGVVMGMGYALTEDYRVENGVPQMKYGTLGLLRATDIPEIQNIIVEKSEESLACGAKGVGEITTIPTAPAIQNAYYRLDGQFRTQLPLENTFYRKKKV